MFYIKRTLSNERMRDLRGLPTHAIAFTTNWWLKNCLPELAILETSDSDFKLDAYAAHGHCHLTPNQDVYTHIDTSWNSDISVAEDSVEEALFDVRWDGHEFNVLRMTWQESFCAKTVHWLTGSNKKVLDGFFATVCKWRPPTPPMVDIFQDGHWLRSHTLYQSIKSSTLDNLLLAPGLKEEIKKDLSHFFESKLVYDRYGIPWKRGVLLSGPPGNGKTHTVKAVINWLDKPALYVKSLKSKHHTEHSMMNSVFSYARRITPCVLVFEDLESIVTPLNRSYFLNELDGFALNTGILVLATTNHPELLDPAITERPSRFDRKYNFDLPTLDARSKYIARWNENIEAEVRLTDSGIETVAAATEGFSFAFLKELFMASLMRWINDPNKQAMDDVMNGQVVVLRTQMASVPTPLPAAFVAGDQQEIDYEEA
jgi:hypothetical protein